MAPCVTTFDHHANKTALIRIIGQGYVGLPLLLRYVEAGYKVLGIDIHEVIRAAATKPFGFVPYYPGPGQGGHCIPIDPYYLTWKARDYGIAESSLLENI